MNEQRTNPNTPGQSDGEIVDCNDLVTLRFCIGVFDSEWFAWAETQRRFGRVPAMGERIEYNDEGAYVVIESVTWGRDGTATIDCEFPVGGDDMEYGRNVSDAVKRFRDAGWTVEVPDDVTLLAG